MRRRIALQLSSTRLSGAFVHCSDSQVLINVSDAQPSLVRAGGFAHGAGGVEARGLEVHIKARIGSFPSVREFQLMVFSDQYHASIDQVRLDVVLRLISASSEALPPPPPIFFPVRSHAVVCALSISISLSALALVRSDLESASPRDAPPRHPRLPGEHVNEPSPDAGRQL